MFCFYWTAVLLGLTFALHARAPIDAERAAELKVTAIGTRVAGTVHIPAFSVATRTGLDLSPLDQSLAELPVLPKSISRSAAKSIQWIHITGYGWLLIPRGWRVVDGGVGADGSMLLMAQSTSGNAWLEYTDAGHCVGCAISQASCFYPQAHAQALEFEFANSECGKDKVSASAPRLPALQYRYDNNASERVQTMRHYHDLDGIRYQQLSVHQARGSKEIDLKQHALGVFFKRIWVAVD